MSTPKKPHGELDQLTSKMREQKRLLMQTRKSFSGAVEHLANIAEGQDNNLDKIISELRVEMRQGGPSPAVINQLATSAGTIGALRRGRAEKLIMGFSNCVAQLLLLSPPADIKKELSEFIRSARRVIASPAEQELLPTRYSRLQKKVLDGLVAKNDLAVKYAVSTRPASDVNLNADDAEMEIDDGHLQGLPAFSTVAEAIEGILTDMVVQIRPPENASEALDRMRHILVAGLNWYELAALLEQLSIVVLAALNNDQQEFEQFLEALNARLSNVNGGVNQIDQLTQNFFATGEEFDQVLRVGIDEFEDELGQAQTVAGLKDSVKSHLENVFEQLDRYKETRIESQCGYEQELQTLRSKVSELEYEAQCAQEEIEVQQRRSEIDGLTCLPNRAAYDRRIEMELERCQRYSRQFCLVVADVDDFKRINDTFGHLAGDKVLKLLAGTMRARLRNTDFIARYGGEEFVIILPESDAEAAIVAMNHICEQIAACPFHHKEQPLKITVSFGVAEVGIDEDAEALFARADNAMYAAKKGGRNRCELADAPVLRVAK